MHILLAILGLCVSASAQTQLTFLRVQNLGGACGGALGYPVLSTQPDYLLFHTDRPICSSQPCGLSLLIVGLGSRPTPIPAWPGVVPGCTYHIDLVVGTLAGSGGVRNSFALLVPRPFPDFDVVMQGLTYCRPYPGPGGSFEVALTDGWDMRLGYR